MGAVYEASHMRVQRQFAIKVLNVKLVTAPQIIARFEREAMIGSRLGHDHIVAVTDFNHTEEGYPFLVMELCKGANLHDALKRDGAFSPVRAVSTARQVCLALTAAHGEGVVHRDLKPANIFLCSRQGGGELVKVMDFGISKVLTSDSIQTSHSSVLGTPSYMAPEQVERGARNVDHRSDIFAMGLVLYHMLSGKMPFEGQNIHSILFQVLNEDPPPLAQFVPSLPPGLDRIVERAIRKQKSERYQSAEEMLNDLASVMGEQWKDVLVQESGPGGTTSGPGSRGSGPPTPATLHPDQLSLADTVATDEQQDSPTWVPGKPLTQSLASAIPPLSSPAGIVADTMPAPSATSPPPMASPASPQPLPVPSRRHPQSFDAVDITGPPLPAAQAHEKQKGPELIIMDGAPPAATPGPMAAQPLPPVEAGSASRPARIPGRIPGRRGAPGLWIFLAVAAVVCGIMVMVLVFRSDKSDNESGGASPVTTGADATAPEPAPPVAPKQEPRPTPAAQPLPEDHAKGEKGRRTVSSRRSGRSKNKRIRAVRKEGAAAKPAVTRIILPAVKPATAPRAPAPARPDARIKPPPSPQYENEVDEEGTMKLGP